MREIEFRGKRVDNGEWGYGYYYVLSDGTHRIYNYFNGGNYQIFPKTICEYIGRKDKNNQKIYEGDIVKVKYSDTFKEFIGIVQYRENHACFYIENKTGLEKFLGTNYYLYEVIGNVYENTELLEEK
jgi:uncharacterized phage protein (TIGR01671 family)